VPEFAISTPRSSYRLQITPSFGLRAAAEVIGYLHRLGSDWVYLSPLLESEPGSDHGYAVVDHGRTDTARGGRAGLEALSAEARGAGMGVLVDIVPNHVGVGTPADSTWWWEVLRDGPDAAHANAFDIDFAAANGRLRLPVLGAGPGELDALRIEDGTLRYYEHAFPLADSTQRLDPREAHDRQHYELINFRLADSELNYRRFFTINSLAGLRVELPEVFAATHVEISQWLDQGWVDGLRVDHPDGLADPTRYLRDLATLTGGGYTVVEKILEPGEDLPADWACAGTTGYDTLALVDRLFVDPAAEPVLDSLDSRLQAGRAPKWHDLVHDTKRAVADGVLGSEVRRLARLAPDLPSATDAIAEVLACFPVYRSYLPAGAEYLRAAAEEARRRRPELTAAIDAVAERAAEVGTEFSVRLQQTSGAVMAKGVEDRAFYRYTRLTSLTEVGADPSVFSIRVDDFHQAQRRRLGDWPNGMTTLSTHDTKRGEDVRARISVLSEIPHRWSDLALSWVERLRFPDGPLASLIFQAAVGTWPIEGARLHDYAIKAAREAGNVTGWIDPDETFESAIRTLVDACYDDQVIAPEVAALADEIRPFGWSNSLGAKLIQITLPGVPDVYQGTEVWDNSLVDPDNRRQVDFGARATLLDRIERSSPPAVSADGSVKLWVTSRALRMRRDRPDLFTGYQPITADGPAADHLIGYDRGGAITLATRLPVGLRNKGGWGDTRLALPKGRWADHLTGAEARAEDVAVADVLARYPVALLVRLP
jgi:(1->4)-alpha-D-glucan 1-alpha-D-glucosylmutase